jgi:hypothetical protein
MFSRWLIPGGVAAILAAPAARPSAILVSDGQPRSTVVLPAEASETLRLAAEELVTHLENMSGARLPIVIGCEPNVMPWIAHYSVCQVHPLGNPRCPPQTNFRRIVEGWKAVSEQIGVREYASWWPVPAVPFPATA